MTLLLWILAVILAIVGIQRLVTGAVVPGVVLLVVAALVGPGGVSLLG